MIMSKNKALENQKIEIENMQSQLKKLDGSVLSDTNSTRDILLVKQKYIILQNDLKKAFEYIQKKRQSMDESIQDGLKNLSRGIKTLENNLMKDKIIDQNSDAADVLKQL